MLKLSRRQTIKLAAGAAVVGPSVLFSRTAAANFIPLRRGLSAGNFAVKIAGLYDGLPAVQKVFLGGVEYSNESIKPQFGMLKIALATESDAPELTLKFGAAQDKTESGLKISVSLFAEQGKTPAITFHAIDAVPHSTSVNKAGNRWLNFAVGSMQTVTHKVRRGHNSALVELPASSLEVSIGSLSFGSVSKLQKYAYDLKTTDVVQVALDPAVASIEWGGPTKVKKSSLEFEDSALEDADRLVVTSFLIAGHTMSWKQKPKVTRAGDKISWKQLTPNLGSKLEISIVTSEKFSRGDDKMWGPVNFAKPRLVNVEFPNLDVGSTALVTQTFSFAVEKGTA